jgi:hypothetical protein
MIGDRMRIIAGLTLSPRSFGGLVTNMEIAIGSRIGVAESTGITLY